MGPKRASSVAKALSIRGLYGRERRRDRHAPGGRRPFPLASRTAGGYLPENGEESVAETQEGRRWPFAWIVRIAVRPVSWPRSTRAERVRCYRCSQVFTFRQPAATKTAVKPAPGPCRLDVGQRQFARLGGDCNEDSFLVQHLRWMNRDDWHEAALLVVADGMGGYQAGDRASRIVIQAVSGLLTPLLTASLEGRAADGTEEAEVERALCMANAEVNAQASRDPTCKGMGATAAVVLVRDNQAFIGHVGDCRVYHHRGGRLTQVTRDQTLVARMVELGQISPQRALTHPARNEVSQAIGKLRRP